MERDSQWILAPGLCFSLLPHREDRIPSWSHLLALFFAPCKMMKKVRWIKHSLKTHEKFQSQGGKKLCLKGWCFYSGNLEMNQIDEGGMFHRYGRHNPNHFFAFLWNMLKSPHSKVEIDRGIDRRRRLILLNQSAHGDSSS